MEGRVDGFNERFDAIDRRFEAVDRRFEAVDRRFESVEQRIDALDAKVDRFREELGGRVESLRVDLGARIAALDSKFDQKLTRYFLWLVGIQVGCSIVCACARPTTSWSQATSWPDIRAATATYSASPARSKGSVPR
ncbi:MAG: hypothetical protein ACE5PT_12460 [Gemmatimonadales bacterium]